MTSEPVVELRAVVKNFSGLRPLRIAELSIGSGERVALAGIDAPGAEVLLNLLTGASLPDEGDVRVFGRPTADVADGDAWLASLDRFGIVSERAVLLEGSTVTQNLALPFTLEIDPVPGAVVTRLYAIAAECGIDQRWLDQPVGAVPPAVRARVQLGRAIALEPHLLLMEHPTAALTDPDRAPFGSVVAHVCAARSLTLVAVTQDMAFASAAAERTLTLKGATGQLVAARRSWWRS